MRSRRIGFRYQSGDLLIDQGRAGNHATLLQCSLTIHHEESTREGIAQVHGP